MPVPQPHGTQPADGVSGQRIALEIDAGGRLLSPRGIVGFVIADCCRNRQEKQNRNERKATIRHGWLLLAILWTNGATLDYPVDVPLAPLFVLTEALAMSAHLKAFVARGYLPCTCL
jgi:hypothetical protein